VKPCHGLTGGIGSGKSTVSALFKDLGIRIVDTDLISHVLTQPNGEAIPAIRNEFGSAFIDAHHALDRDKMRDLFFSDSAARNRLEKILHPLILEHAKAQALSPTDAPYTLVVVPLLLESGRYHDWLDRVIVVDCDETKQIARTTQRGRLSEDTVRTIMQNQAGRLQRLQQADDIIHNDGDLIELRERVKNLHSRLINL